MDLAGNNSQNWLLRQHHAACNGVVACTQERWESGGWGVDLGSASGTGGACTLDVDEVQKESTDSSSAETHSLI